jgi:hypothetical protein
LPVTPIRGKYAACARRTSASRAKRRQARSEVGALRERRVDHAVDRRRQIRRQRLDAELAHAEVHGRRDADALGERRTGVLHRPLCLLHLERRAGLLLARQEHLGLGREPALPPRLARVEERRRRDARGLRGRDARAARVEPVELLGHPERDLLMRAVEREARRDELLSRALAVGGAPPEIDERPREIHAGQQGRSANDSVPSDVPWPSSTTAVRRARASAGTRSVRPSRAAAAALPSHGASAGSSLGQIDQAGRSHAIGLADGRACRQRLVARRHVCLERRGRRQGVAASGGAWAAGSHAASGGGPSTPRPSSAASTGAPDGSDGDATIAGRGGNARGLLRSNRGNRQLECP